MGLWEDQLLTQNIVIVSDIKELLEKSFYCYKQVQQLDSYKALDPLVFVFCMRLFEKARFNLCQANYNCTQLVALLDSRLATKHCKLNRRLQDFEQIKGLGTEGRIKACLKSIKFSVYGDKIGNQEGKTSYE